MEKVGVEAVVGIEVQSGGWGGLVLGQLTVSGVWV